MLIPWSDDALAVVLTRSPLLELRLKLSHETSSMAPAANLFISYAHEDADLKDQLVQHLAGLLNDGLIRIWHDREIKAGEYWATRIDNALERSSIVLLLISPSFLASSYCYGSELKRALRKASAGEATVVPIILRASDWQTRELRGLQALPRDGRAVTTWANRDEAFFDVVEGLKAAIGASQHSPPAAVAPVPAKVRYYIYISDAKVNMLFPQIASEPNMSPARGTGDARIQRLEAVLRFIEGSGRIGSIDEPSDYVFGSEELYWGHFHESDIAENRSAPAIVAFCGRTPRTTMLMCGATRHLVGNHQPEVPGYSSSHVPYLLKTLLTAVELEGGKPEDIIRQPSGNTEAEKLPRRGRELALALVSHAWGHVDGVEQKLEFLAKPLLSGPGLHGAQRCLLASPLYVSLAF